MDNRSDIWRGIDAIKPRFIALSDKVWATPEVCYTEARSAAEHLTELRHQGFRITENVADIPTALMGEWGEGGPVIAFLGEYDALPGSARRPASRSHGRSRPAAMAMAAATICSGSAALLAATAVKDWLAAHKVPGRVRYYGCPAEEGGAAKTFMVRSGAFDDADIALSWHPLQFLGGAVTPSLANTRADFIFTGRTSHAAASPHLGRSALDAVELMNVGVNYMREHMPSDARVHYAAARYRRHRAQRGAGPCPGPLFDPRPRPARHERAGAARPQDRTGRGADDRNQDGDADHLRGLQSVA